MDLFYGRFIHSADDCEHAQTAIMCTERKVCLLRMCLL